MRYLSIIFAVLLFSSCFVSKKKFDAETAQRESYEARSMGLERDLNRANDTIATLRNELTDREGRITSYEQQLTSLDQEKEKLQNQLNQVVGNALSQQERMGTELRTKQNALSEKEGLITDLQTTIRQREEALREVMDKVKNAVRLYSREDLSVEMKNGKVYIALSDNLLFRSGSAKIDRKGKAAIGTLAEVLVAHPDMTIVVEGHTDNVPARGSAFEDNWDLSVLRATAVVRLLTDEYKLDPNQVTAAGKGEYAPKADNTAADGRAQNRRIEIMVEPKLDEIYQLVRSGSL